MLLWNFILWDVSIKALLLVLQIRILSIQQDHDDFWGEMYGQILQIGNYIESFYFHCFFFKHLFLNVLFLNSIGGRTPGCARARTFVFVCVSE